MSKAESLTVSKSWSWFLLLYLFISIVFLSQCVPGDNHFIGNNSDKPQEQVGQLPVGIFSGFVAHYYVELRLRPLQQTSQADLVR